MNTQTGLTNIKHIYTALVPIYTSTIHVKRGSVKIIGQLNRLLPGARILCANLHSSYITYGRVSLGTIKTINALTDTNEHLLGDIPGPIIIRPVLQEQRGRKLPTWGFSASLLAIGLTSNTWIRVFSASLLSGELDSAFWGRENIDTNTIVWQTVKAPAQVLSLQH